MNSSIDRSARIEAALVELLRLYEWRFILALREKDPCTEVPVGLRNREEREYIRETQALLNRYGREKKAAWAVAREVLRALPATATEYKLVVPERDPNAEYCKHGWDTRLSCSSCLQERQP